MTALQIDPSVVQYLQNHRSGVLATSKRRGSPQQTLIAYHFDGNDIAISTRAPSQKAKNISKRPDVSLAVIDGPAQLIAYGTATVVRDPEQVYRLHRERMSQISTRNETDDELAQRLQREERVVILLQPTSFYPTTMQRRT
jgi:PPOX class probable F420-dependent enzyme